MKLNINNSSLLISAGNLRQIPSVPIPQVAFSGRSNVGKSSLINNLLCRKKLARVSGTPGKTITINFYNVDNKLMLADLPGYGFAKRTKEEQVIWSTLTDGFFTQNRNIDLLKCTVQLIDARIGATKDDLQMIDFLSSAGLTHIIVYTKADKLNASERRKLEAQIKDSPLSSEAAANIIFSSETGEGRNELLSILCGICKIN